MQLNKVHSVKTIDMETEDGVIWVYGPGDDSVIAFSPFGIENLRDLIEMDRDYGR